jgi:hypothetical protein
MALFKKLLLIPFLFLSLYAVFQLYLPFTNSTELIFSLSLPVMKQLLLLGSSILLFSLLFLVFVSLSQDWKIVTPVIILLAALAAVLIPGLPGYILGLGLFFILSLVFATVLTKITTYITFDASMLFSSPIKMLSMLCCIVLAASYFVSINNIIAKQGFAIPDTLIDQALKMSPQLSNTTLTEEAESSEPIQLPTISDEQLSLIKKNPALYKQYGVTPEMIQLIEDQKKNPGKDLITKPTVKNLVKDQFEQMLKPYLTYIPGFLALMFFLVVNSMIALLGLFVSPLLGLLYLIFEKTGFITFEITTREVKKMVV